MEFSRVLLYGALFFTLMMMYQAWQKDYGPQPVVTVEGEQVLPPAGSVPEVQAGADGSEVPTGPDAAMQSGKGIQVSTDVLDITIDTMGGDIRYLALADYPVEVDTPEVPVVLLDESAELLHVAQSGLKAGSRSTLPAPTHEAIFSATQDEYRLADGEEQLEVILTWQQQGITVNKVYTFTRGSYLVELRYEIENGSDAAWSASLYAQLQRTKPTHRDGMAMTYTGGVVYTDEERYEKVDFDEIADGEFEPRKVRGGWLAMIQHYFLAAWLPTPESSSTFYTMALGADNDRYFLGLYSNELTVVEPGSSASTGIRFYAGPKLQDNLEQMAEGLELTVDYGWLTVISKPLFWLLSAIEGLIGNWGWAIIILTVIIKAAFYRLSATSYRSMAQMRKLQPRLQALKEKYGDDRQKMGEAMMRMYREEKINPLGGCWPILVQIPVFIALYYALLESVEIRQATFLWINDLSSADPLFILPVLMGLSMVIQQRLNPTPLDPIQAKVMMALPIVFTIFFAFFPAGLVLYWTMNSVLSLVQQWYITRSMGAIKK